jgi:hypothetical protein
MNETQKYYAETKIGTCDYCHKDITMENPKRVEVVLYHEETLQLPKRTVKVAVPKQFNFCNKTCATACLNKN